MKRYSKFVVALLAAAGVVASSGLLAGTAQLILTTAIAAVGAGLVYLVPNVQLPDKVSRHRTDS